jgi:chloride channel 2
MGKYHVSELGTHGHIITLFSETSWNYITSDNDTILNKEERWVQDYWNTDSTDYFTNMTIFMIVTFFTSILALTLPVPNGALIPAFKIGAALGRLVGESVSIFFPSGMGKGLHMIAAGGYATIGAAAFTGAVTHTLSISVIIFELTGQITHAIPMLIAVIISNRIAEVLHPSCYDSVILIKKLPYLPNILPASSSVHRVFVEDFMVREVKYIWYGMSYRELREVLTDGKKLRSFPLVDRPDKMVLLGSIQRAELIGAIERQIGKERRRKEAMRRHESDIEDQKNSYEENVPVVSGQSSLSEQRPSIFDTLGIDPVVLQQLASKPNKSSLKKSSSYSINPSDSPMRPIYRTVTAAEPTWKLALDNLQNMFKKSDQR